VLRLSLANMLGLILVRRDVLGWCRPRFQCLLQLRCVLTDLEMRIPHLLGYLLLVAGVHRSSGCFVDLHSFVCAFR
jgi:chromosome condensin MukBEF MukE localization factor